MKVISGLVKNSLVKWEGQGLFAEFLRGNGTKEGGGSEYKNF